MVIQGGASNFSGCKSRSIFGICQKIKGRP